MIDLNQLRDYVVYPALKAIGHAEPAAVRLVIGTGLMESNYQYLAQVSGPALGLWQMEPATATDIFLNFLPGKSDLHSNLLSLMCPNGDHITQLTWNLQYAAAMCRIKYLRSPLPLPNLDDLQGLANYHKSIYNSDLGSANPAIFIQRALNAGLMNL